MGEADEARSHYTTKKKWIVKYIFGRVEYCAGKKRLVCMPRDLLKLGHPEVRQCIELSLALVGWVAAPS